jgi:hypothetical protein
MIPQLIPIYTRTFQARIRRHARQHQFLHFPLPQLKIQIRALKARAVSVLIHHHIPITQDIWSQAFEDLRAPAVFSEVRGVQVSRVSWRDTRIMKWSNRAVQIPNITVKLALLSVPLCAITRLGRRDQFSSRLGICKCLYQITTKITAVALLMPDPWPQSLWSIYIIVSTSVPRSDSALWQLSHRP